jgi:hypothetical protein
MEAVDPSLVIINDVLRTWALFCVSMLVLAGCGDRLRSKDLVQQAIVKRLQSHSGLDLNSLDVTTTSVSFDKKMAYATVAFHPKGDPGVNSGLVMKYTLQERSGQWEVVNVGDSRGGPLSGHAGMGSTPALPAGHPSVDGLPPGHPDVHPDVNAPHAQPAPRGAQGQAQ